MQHNRANQTALLAALGRPGPPRTRDRHGQSGETGRPAEAALTTHLPRHRSMSQPCPARSPFPLHQSPSLSLPAAVSALSPPLRPVTSSASSALPSSAGVSGTWNACRAPLQRPACGAWRPLGCDRRVSADVRTAQTRHPFTVDTRR